MKKTTTTKKVVEEKVESVADSEVITEEIPVREEVVTATVEKSAPKNYSDEDLIECRSITRGELILIGKKSKNKYVFANYDDTCEIEVGDLNALRASKSAYLYDPLFVIEDDKFVSQPKWKDIKKMYDENIANDINVILEKPLGEFKNILKNLPKGYKDALCDEVATRIRNDEFDSIKKIKAIDDICGTELNILSN